MLREPASLYGLVDRQQLKFGMAWAGKNMKEGLAICCEVWTMYEYM